MPRKTTPRGEVDGTIPGVAMLVMADLSQGADATPMHESIVESASVTNPHQSAVRLWESTKDDFPGHTMTVLLNERARYLMTKGRMESMLRRKFTVDQYLKINS